MIVLIIILLAASAFFSSAETAFSSLSKIRLKSRVEDGDKKAAEILKMAEEFDSLLSTILIGNNIVNIAMASIAAVLFTGWLGNAGASVSTAVMTIVVLIFGEVTPKALAKEMPEQFAGFCAPVLRILMTILNPVNWLFRKWKEFLSKSFKPQNRDFITEDEIVTMVSEAARDGELTDRESELIRSAISFDDVEVEEVLTPRVDVKAVEDDASPEKALEILFENGFSRLPVYHETIDNIIGIVHEKELFRAIRRGESDLTEIMAPAVYTTCGTRISELLKLLREGRHHMAVVVDEYGGTEGIITLEDILEELVGEIWDEHDDVVEEIHRQSDGSYLISGDAGVDEVCELLGIREESDDAVSMSGLVQDRLEKVPRVGDRFTWDGYEGVVTRCARRRVLEIRLRKKADRN